MPNKLTDSEKIAKWQKEKFGEKNYNEIQEKAKHDSEIVKDLNEAEDLENVLLYCKNPNKEVMIPIKITDIRDLINRLQKADEKNKDSIRLLQLAIDQKRQKILRLEEENRDLQEEVKNLEAENKDLIKDNQSLKAEIERLKDRVNKQGLVAQIVIDDDKLENIKDECLERIECNIKEIKAEAYKEFVERLKEKLFDPVETWITSNVVREEDIDNLLKELVGEDN